MTATLTKFVAAVIVLFCFQGVFELVRNWLESILKQWDALLEPYQGTISGFVFVHGKKQRAKTLVVPSPECVTHCTDSDEASGNPERYVPTLTLESIGLSCLGVVRRFCKVGGAYFLCASHSGNSTNCCKFWLERSLA
jgi:hypothetical protein